MLGDLIYEHKGKITSQRVLGAEGPKIGASFSGSANTKILMVQRLEHI